MPGVHTAESDALQVWSPVWLLQGPHVPHIASQRAPSSPGQLTLVIVHVSDNTHCELHA